MQFTVTPAGGGARTVLRFHQERMAGPEERELQRAHWESVPAAVAAALGRSGPA